MNERWRPTLRACAPYGEPDWVPFPKGFARDKEVTPILKGMMIALCSFLDWNTGYGSPTYRDLSEASGLEKWRMRQLLRGLCELGYLDIKERSGSGLEYRLKGGPLRLNLAEGGGTARPHPPGTARPHPPGTARPHPIDSNDDDLIWVLKKYGIDDEDAAEIVAAMPAPRLRQLLSYVEAKPQIANPARYIVAAFRKERPSRRVRAEQMPLRGPTPFERPAPADPPLPPAEASWLSDEQRAAAVARAKAIAFPHLARQGA